MNTVSVQCLSFYAAHNILCATRKYYVKIIKRFPFSLDTNCLPIILDLCLEQKKVEILTVTLSSRSLSPSLSPPISFNTATHIHTHIESPSRDTQHFIHYRFIHKNIACAIINIFSPSRQAFNCT